MDAARSRPWDPMRPSRINVNIHDNQCSFGWSDRCGVTGQGFRPLLESAARQRASELHAGTAPSLADASCTTIDRGQLLKS